MIRKIYSPRVTRETSRVQIHRLDAAGKIFEVNDALDVDPKLSKLHVKIVEYPRAAPGEKSPASTDVEHWVDADVMKALCTAILEGRLESLAGLTAAQVRDGKDLVLYEEMKGTPKDGGHESRILTLKLSSANKFPYEFAIVNGPGEVMGQGAVKPSRLGAEFRRRCFICVSRLDLYVMAREVLDYVRDWEVRCFTARQAARTITIAPLLSSSSWTADAADGQEGQRWAA